MTKDCIPPDLQQQADDAEKRKDDALDRLLARLDGQPAEGDAFERAMVRVIDADKEAVEMLRKRKDR